MDPVLNAPEYAPKFSGYNKKVRVPCIIYMEMQIYGVCHLGVELAIGGIAVMSLTFMLRF